MRQTFYKKIKNRSVNLFGDINALLKSIILYEDIDTTIKDVLANKIKKEHLTNYLKHSYRIYK
jgi:hypothetical protein